MAKINYTERLKRLRQRRDPDGLELSEAADLTSRNQGYVPPEEVMAPLQKLDQWTLGALHRYAAANLKSQGTGEVTPEEINQWIYTYLSYYTFEELMAEVKAHTDGAFEGKVDSKAKTLVNEVLKRARQQTSIPQLESLLAKQTKPARKQFLEGLLSKAKKLSLVEGKKHRVVLFKPCDECHQEEGKIEECKRCKGCGIDPSFQIRIFEDPRNPINEILPGRRLPTRPG